MMNFYLWPSSPIPGCVVDQFSPNTPGNSPRAPMKHNDSRAPFRVDESKSPGEGPENLHVNK